jgi:hypothetical protein
MVASAGMDSHGGRSITGVSHDVSEDPLATTNL